MFLLLTLIIVITFVGIIAGLFQGLVKLVKNRKTVNFRPLLPLFIYTLTILYTFFSPYRFDSENLESGVVLIACFEGTQNQAVLKFRKNNTFDIHWTGTFFANNWYFGTYKKVSDTIFLSYKSERPYRIGDTLLNANQELLTLNQSRIDTQQYFVSFYVGRCLGLN